MAINFIEIDVILVSRTISVSYHWTVVVLPLISVGSIMML